MKWPHSLPRPADLLVEIMCQWVGLICAVLFLIVIFEATP